jgi:IMP dehydrogenase
VVERGSGKLVGILTNRDMRFESRPGRTRPVLMTREGLITVREGVTQAEARDLLRRHKIERLIVVDDAYRAVGLITVKDMEKAQAYPHAAKDAQGRLLVGAASTVGDAGYERSMALVDAGVDVVVIDTAHGHSTSTSPRRSAASSARTTACRSSPATSPPTTGPALIDAGADAVKVGIGPGSICTTRIVAGVGVPQLTAIADAVRAARERRAGDRRRRHQIFRATWPRPSPCRRLGGHDGLGLRRHRGGPGEVFLYQGRSYKSYRGMGSLGAMARARRTATSRRKSRTPEAGARGHRGPGAYKGPIGPILHQLVGGLRAAMGYVGRRPSQVPERARFVRITGAGLRESHVHDVMITREAPNYPSAV